MKLRETIFAFVCVGSFLFARGVGKLLGYKLTYIGTKAKKGKHNMEVVLEGGK